MIPILSDTYPMTGNGLGGLSDAIECKVTDEVNGEYELVMKYPLTGEHYAEIQIGYIIMAKPMALANAEPFRVYRITKPLNGVVTIYARHISYDMSGIIIEPCTAASLTAALTTIPANAVPSCPFSLASSRTVASAITVTEPKTLWSLLGGSAGSFLDVYGGEWEFSGMTATLKTTLGTNRGVEIRYGKNLTQLENDADTTTTYGGVYPFWYDDTDGLVTLPEGYIAITGSPYTRILLLDCTEEFDTKPSENDLRTYTQNYITNNAVGSMKTSWKVSFALLAQSGEYDTQSLLEAVQLGDNVKIIYDALGVNATARVVKTEWDVLGDKYISVIIGRVKQNLASILVGNNRETERAIAQTKSALEIAIANSTNFIKNGTGVMRFIYNSSGDLMEIVSLDNADITQAQSVWRWNNGGFGHSSTGYNGAYTTAITQNGAIVADFITTGTLNAQRVKTGILSDALNKNSWNLDTGSLSITDGDITITATKVYAYSDYSQTDLDRIDDIRSGSVTPTDADFEKYDINGDGNISAQDRMYIVKMMNTSTDLTRTITTAIDPKANTETIKIRYQITPDMGGTTPAIDKTYYVGGPRTKLGNLSADSLTTAWQLINGNANATHSSLTYDSGLQFYDANNALKFTYPSYGLYAQDMGSRNLLRGRSSGSNGGVTFTVNSNGSVSTTNTATSNAFFSWQFTIPAGTYTLTGCPSGGGINTYRMDVRDASAGNVINDADGNPIVDTGDGCTFRLTSSLTAWFNIRIASGQAGGLTFYPMIRPSTVTDSTYYPYALTNRELTEKVAWNEYSASGNVTIGTTWTDTGLAYTIPAQGWYFFDAYSSFSNTRPTGAAVMFDTGNAWILDIKEYSDSTFFGKTFVGQHASGFVYLANNGTIRFLAKHASSGSNACFLRVKGPILQ